MNQIFNQLSSDLISTAWDQTVAFFADSYLDLPTSLLDLGSERLITQSAQLDLTSLEWILYYCAQIFYNLPLLWEAIAVNTASLFNQKVYIGGIRPVEVIAPNGYDPSQPAPLLIFLHGYNHSGPQYEGFYKLTQTASDNGFVYLYPSGIKNAAG